MTTPPRTGDGPAICFYSAIPDTVEPTPADKSAQGAMSMKAYRFCEPMRAASAYGWYIFPPCDIAVEWDGRTGIECWLNDEPMGLLDGAGVDGAHYPGFEAYFDRFAPTSCQGYVPDVVTAVQEPGVVNIWTGWLVRTAPEWSLNLRSVVNRPALSGYEVFEGIVETDRWFGPLFTNVRLTRTGRVEFRHNVPILQAQPIPRYVYQMKATSKMRVLGTRGEQRWRAEDWQRYRATVIERDMRGHYATTSRQRPKP